ncbi:hypothetical protein LJY25_14820 [Hymenobacter sp. BT175]|uniref:hypothetical protein n=1 Tax=Hymenobacter translucens TaxID=2886507 RepID=UPI001D0DE536|nr:hypothetical protein [Hymenobacter translucens]MCC2547726.1 hypothetical protein [Hymenobacter translucens]
MGYTRFTNAGGIVNNYGGPVDEYYYFRLSETLYRPYADLTEARATVPVAFRSGRTVNIGGTEYWWKHGATADEQLVAKGGGGGDVDQAEFDALDSRVVVLEGNNQIIASPGGLVVGLSGNQSTISTDPGFDANLIVGGDDNLITGAAGLCGITGGAGNLIQGGTSNLITNSTGCIIPATCNGVTLLNCSSFTAPANTQDKTYINNAEAGTGGADRYQAAKDDTGRYNDVVLMEPKTFALVTAGNVNATGYKAQVISAVDNTAYGPERTTDADVTADLAAAFASATPPAAVILRVEPQRVDVTRVAYTIFTLA